MPLILLLSIAIHACYIGSKVVVSLLVHAAFGVRLLLLPFPTTFHLLAIASFFIGIGSGGGQPLDDALLQSLP